MQIFKVIFLSAMGIALILFIIRLWAWEKPESIPVDYSADVNNRPQLNNNVVIYDTGGNIEGLIAKWELLNPDILLVERDKGFLLPGLMDPLKKFGIAGKAEEIALKKKVKIFTFSLSDEKIAECLVKKYSPEQISFSIILNSYFEYLSGNNSLMRDNLLKDRINEYRNKGMNGNICSIETIDKIWKRDFPEARNWRDTNHLPGYAGEIENEINNIKEKYYNSVINYFTDRNKKIFVIRKTNSNSILQK